MRKILIALLSVCSLAAAAQGGQPVTREYNIKVGGGSGGVADGNDYPTSMTHGGTRLFLNFQRLPTLSIAFDTTYGGLATLQGTLYRLDSLKRTLGNMENKYPTAQTFSGLTLTTTRVDDSVITASLDTAAGGVAARLHTDKNFVSRPIPYIINGQRVGTIYPNFNGTIRDTVQYYDPTGANPAPGESGTVAYTFIRNNVANRVIATEGRTDTTKAIANFVAMDGKVGIGNEAPANTLDVTGTFNVTQAATFGNKVIQNMTSQGGTGEVLQSIRVNDAGDEIGIYNNSSVDGRFLPAIYGYNATASNLNALRMLPLTHPSLDTVGGAPLMSVRAGLSLTGIGGARSDVVNRALFAVGNAGGGYPFQVWPDRTQADRFQITPVAVDAATPLEGEISANNVAKVPKIFLAGQQRSFAVDNGSGFYGFGITEPITKIDVRSGVIQSIGDVNGLRVGDLATTRGSFTWEATQPRSLRLMNDWRVTEIMRFDSSNRMGLGITSPLYRLHVAGRGAFFGTASDNGIVFGNTAGTTRQTALKNLENGNIALIDETANATRWVIDNTGKMGIGILAPTSLLDVAGVITATGGNSSQWNTAYSWGNHAGLYKAISYVPAWTEITGRPAFATVATSGSYSDLLNRPTIPTQTSQLTNNSGFISSEVDGSVTNEIQTLSIAGSTVSLSNGGGSVALPSEGLQIITTTNTNIAPTKMVMNVLYDGPEMGSTPLPAAPADNQVLYIRNNTNSTLTVGTYYLGATITTTTVGPNENVKLHYLQSNTSWYRVQ